MSEKIVSAEELERSLAAIERRLEGADNWAIKNVRAYIADLGLLAAGFRDRGEALATLQREADGMREALALAAERLAVAATRVDRADTEFGFRVWADEARNAAGRAVVDLTAEPQFRLTLSEEARAEIERLERANAAAAANLGNALIGSPQATPSEDTKP